LNRKSTAAIPDGIAQLQRQLDQFRSTQPRRTKLPEPLWQAAVELAREYGIYSVAHPLRLDYMGLKKRLGGIPTVGGEATKPAVVELTAPQTAAQHECAIDFECPSGNKMRIQWKASTPPDWGQSAACLAGNGRMIQIAAQTRIVVAVEAIDGRKYAPSIRLRCNACGEVFTAHEPETAGSAKYHETAVAMIALQKYGTGVPFKRLERLQGQLGLKALFCLF
jgi:hypothetical protein